jgi:hypothetical protein
MVGRGWLRSLTFDFVYDIVLASITYTFVISLLNLQSFINNDLFIYVISLLNFTTLAFLK